MTTEQVKSTSAASNINPCTPVDPTASQLEIARKEIGDAFDAQFPTQSWGGYYLKPETLKLSEVMGGGFSFEVKATKYESGYAGTTDLGTVKFTGYYRPGMESFAPVVSFMNNPR